MDHFWNYVCGLLAVMCIPAGLWWQLHIWEKCFTLRGSDVQLRSFRVTFGIPWRLCGKAVISAPLVLGALVLSGEVFGVGIDDDDFLPATIALWIVTTLFAIKVSCGALLIGVTGLLVFMELATDSSPELPSLFGSLFDVVLGGAPDWVIWVYTAGCLGYAMHSAVVTTITKGVSAAVADAYDLRG